MFVYMWCWCFIVWCEIRERYERQEVNVEHTVNEVSYDWDHLSHTATHYIASVQVTFEGWL